MVASASLATDTTTGTRDRFSTSNTKTAGDAIGVLVGSRLAAVAEGIAVGTGLGARAEGLGAGLQAANETSSANSSRRIVPLAPILVRVAGTAVRAAS